MELGEVWKKLFYRRLRGKPEPLFVFKEGAVSAAALWMGIRLWMQRWQEEEPLVFCGLPAGPEYLEVLGACLSRKGTFIAGHPERGTEALVQEVDQWQPDYVVVERSLALEFPGYVYSEEVNENRSAVCLVRERGYQDLQEAHPLRTLIPVGSDRRVVLSTSGTTGSSRWVILSDRSLFSVLRSHIPALKMRKARVLSMLPWNHAFGLILDLLPSILRATTVVRCQALNPPFFRSLHRRFQIDYMSTVPVVMERLSSDSEAIQALRGFRGGLLGGAPVESFVSEQLSGTRFRVGYGQTEAGPGITLGSPGVFSPGFIGTPVGCEARVEDGTLRYRGPNVCTAVVTFPPERKQDHPGMRQRISYRMEQLRSALELRCPDQWHDTADIVEPLEQGFRYLGRRDHNFKLSNGRFLDAARVEARLGMIEGIQRAILIPEAGGFRSFLVLNQDHMRLDRERIREALGSLASYLRGISLVHPGNLPLNAKGIVCRNQLKRELAYATE